MPKLSIEERAIRREKKTARRLRQRAANIGHAEKMHIARLETPVKTPSLKARKLKSKIHIGCSGWFYWDWRKIFYPENLPTKDWFGYYGSQFETVELNAPFYSWPTVGTVKGWVRQAGTKRFVYTIKVCELITHIKRFQGTKNLISDFYYIGDLLGPAMGCFLFQLSPSFKYSAARLKNILSQLDRKRRNVVEFRHTSWWSEHVFKAFRKKGIIFCSCSAPKLPSELIKTADDIYVRFHGTNKWYRHDYSEDDLSAWSQKIKASKAKQVWVYFNNDFDGYAIKNARQLERLLINTGKKRDRIK